MAESEEYVDPFEAHAKREPMAGAGVRVVVLALGELPQAESVADALVKRLAGRSRKAESRVVAVGSDWGKALAAGIEGATLPLVLVTTATEPWTDQHLAPLLESIDRCDHVVGQRPAPRAAR